MPKNLAPQSCSPALARCRRGFEIRDPNISGEIADLREAPTSAALLAYRQRNLGPGEPAGALELRTPILAETPAEATDGEAEKRGAAKLMSFGSG